MIEYHYDGGSVAPIHLEDNTWNPEHRLVREVVCSPYRNTKRALFCFSWLGDVHPSHRLSFQAFPLVGVDSFNQSQSLLGRHGFDSIYPCRSLALVVLRHPTDGEHSGCSGLHQKFLQFVNCSAIATLFSLKDALLYAVRMLLKLAPGQLAPTLTLRIRKRLSLLAGCLRLCHTTCASFFHVIVPTSAYSAAFPLALAS